MSNVCMSNVWEPQTARQLAAFFNEIIERWDEELTDEDRASGDYINPDEPVVMDVPNPEWDGDPGEYGEDDYGNAKRISFHIMCIGGGGDVDDDGEDCGHNGVELSGMGIDQRSFLCNGRRLKKLKTK